MASAFLASRGTSVICYFEMWGHKLQQLLDAYQTVLLFSSYECILKLFAEYNWIHAYDKSCFQNTLIAVFFIRPAVESILLSGDEGYSIWRQMAMKRLFSRQDKNNFNISSHHSGHTRGQTAF